MRDAAIRVSSRFSKSIATGFLLLAGGLVTTAASSGCGSSTTDGGPVTSPCPPGQTCQARITLLHTSDIHSRLFPYDVLITQIDSDLGLGPLGEIRNVGGVARMMYVLERERARADRVLHLDSGDIFQGAPIFNFYGGEPETRAHSYMGTDCAVIGNHEFDRGALNVTTQFQRWGNYISVAANYKYDDAASPSSPKLSTVSRPFAVFNREGLKVAVIGMANLSSLTSVFDQPNRLGITPLNTIEVAQFYIDLLRPYVDLVVAVSHLGLDNDQKMVRGTTGLDAVLGGHNHIVINPPQEIRDCSADPQNPGFVWTVDPNIPFTDTPPNDEAHPDPVNHPFKFKRPCKPRNVIIAHSGAFAKYVGRLDLVVSNKPAEITPTGVESDYDPINGFEIISNKYQAFPMDDRVPEEPRMVELLQPYRRQLDKVADLDILVGFAPTGARRVAPQGGDSPLGNTVATAMWLRLGIQTDFSLTNTTGIRTDLNPGPITIESMYNIFPFDNSISKMQLSGVEVREMFDFVARRSAGRGCVSQAQVAGARVRMNCKSCNRPGPACNTDEECLIGASGCDLNSHTCVLTSCAEEVYIGTTAKTCKNDNECAGDDGVVHPGHCDVNGSLRCFSRISDTNLYELATSNYLAGGGSGFRTLQRNTTQFDTKVQQRDALIDYLRQGKPCGFKLKTDDKGKPVIPKTPLFPTAEGLKACATDGDCASEGDNFACACPNPSISQRRQDIPLDDPAQELHVRAITTPDGAQCSSDKTTACDPGVGRCVLKDCRTQVAAFHNRRCTSSPAADACKVDLDACSIGGETCKLLSCVDRTSGAFTDNRLEMVGK